jgi:hypothetical protein
MNKIIEQYYKSANIMPLLLKKKMAAFEKHPDIASEFEYWINNKQYCDGVSIEGYTAKNIAGMSPYMDGEGAFMLLIELRENPGKAKARITKGFKMK